MQYKKYKMKNTTSNLAKLAGITVVLLLMFGCNSIQPILVLTPGDFVALAFADFVLSFVLALYMSEAKSKIKFWLWFIIGFFIPIILITAAIVKGVFGKDKDNE